MADYIRKIQTDNQYITYHLSLQKVKNINMRVLSSGIVSVSAPLHIPLEYVDDFVCSKAQWILKAQQRVQQRQKNLDVGQVIYLWGKPYPFCFEDGSKRLEIKENEIRLYTPSHIEESGKISILQQELKKLLEKEILIQRGKFDEIIHQYHCSLPTIQCRRMKSKWGSCMVKKSVIHINSSLIHYPKECLSYILLHEYMHLVVPNHSKRFYELMEYYLPDYKKINKILNGYPMQ